MPTQIAHSGARPGPLGRFPSGPFTGSMNDGVRRVYGGLKFLMARPMSDRCGAGSCPEDTKAIDQKRSEVPEHLAEHEGSRRKHC
jgi:hypothetical protein